MKLKHSLLMQYATRLKVPWSILSGVIRIIKYLDAYVRNKY
jgi:hypothetical protein